MFTKNKTGYLAQVETWLQKEVFPPITRAYTDRDPDAFKEAHDRAVKLIKEKILESYKNGVSAGQK